MANETLQHETTKVEHSTADMLIGAGKEVEPCAKNVLDRLDRIIRAGERGRREDDKDAKKLLRRILAHVNF
ncbi:MAG: hypothetical protein CMJ35_02815 [Phycisphaerae bacterium]|nr:hypothetical protein [Phycisphaerae bacterium]MBM90531.1 hypothetical protein [Phycisphaerae bacterium]HCT44557.1 hypothetical protein [Phycisphaerales bacterium]|tara:strand:- start:286 stop:498 length:213 start_codon:yes stop_codon:yes gene_type:complete